MLRGHHHAVLALRRGRRRRQRHRRAPGPQGRRQRQPRPSDHLHADPPRWLVAKTVGGHPARAESPPVQHPQRPQRDPARRLPDALVHREPDTPARRPVERPAPVGQPAPADLGDRLAEPRVGAPAVDERGGAEVVEPAQDVVAPAVRVPEQQEVRVGRLAGREPAEQRAFQQERLAGSPGGAHRRRAAGRALVLQQPLDHVDRRVERRPRRAVGPLAVPAAVRLPLAEQALDDRPDVDAEVGAVGDGAAVDALLDLALPVGLPALVPAAVRADKLDGAPRLLRARVEAELPKLRQREAGGGPGLPFLLPRALVETGRRERAARPLAVPILAGEERRAPSVGLDPRPLGPPVRLRRIEQVAHDLPADRRIGVEEPVDHRRREVHGGNSRVAKDRHLEPSSGGRSFKSLAAPSAARAAPVRPSLRVEPRAGSVYRAGLPHRESSRNAVSARIRRSWGASGQGVAT